MNAFFEHHKNSIRLHYRCFDRLLLNGLIQPFQQPERVIGFFNSYRQGRRVTRNELGDIAEQYKNWVTNRSQKWGVPVLEAPDGRRDDFIDPYFKPSPIRSSRFFAPASRAASWLPMATRRMTVGICKSRNVGSCTTTST